MRVLVVSPAAGLGGAERCLLGILTALRQEDPELELHVLMLARGPLRARIEQLGIPTFDLPLPESLAGIGETHSSPRVLARSLLGALRATPEALEFARDFRRHVARLQPDLLHTNGLKAHLLGATLLRKQSIALHVHDFFGDRPLSRWLLYAAERRRLLAIAISQAVACDLRRVLPSTAVRVVYNAVDHHTFSPGTGDPAWLAELAGLPPPAPGTLSFGMVSTYARWKGQEVFLRAAARLKSAGIPSRFYVVGGPIYSTAQSQFSPQELLQLATELGLGAELGFVPFQANTTPVYRALDVAVHPSTKPEPFGLSIVEAMACGLPVIVAKNGGAQELFQDGTTALGFETGSDADLARCMQRFALDSELRQRLGTAARHDVVQRFAPPRLAREIRAAYQALLELEPRR
jgi:glycosyltransferase involved in cell wall biosynthesis